MAVKLADTLAPMGDFEIAEAKDISVMIGDTKKRLQQAIEDGDIGGAGNIVVKCTEAQYGALLPAQKALNVIYSTEKFLYYHDESIAPVVDVEAITDTIGDLEELKTEEKGSVVGAINEVSDSLVDLDTFKIYTELESFVDVSKNNIKFFGVYNGGNDYGAPSTRMSFGRVQVQLAPNGTTRCIQTLDYSTQEETTRIYSRTGLYSNGSWAWGEWVEYSNKAIMVKTLAMSSGNRYNLSHLLGVNISNVINIVGAGNEQDFRYSITNGGADSYEVSILSGNGQARIFLIPA